MESLQTLKQALDLGLITAQDYDVGKAAFLKAQSIRSGFESGLLSPVDYALVKETFLTSVAGVAPGAAQAQAQRTVVMQQPVAAAAAPPARAAAPQQQYQAPPPVQQQQPAYSAPPPAQPQQQQLPPRPAVVHAPAPAPQPAAPAPAPAQRSSAPVSAPAAATHAPISAIPAGDNACVKGKSLSGIFVTERCVSVYNELKTKSQNRFLIFRIDDDRVVPDASGPAGCNMVDFAESLPENDCRYAVYDFDYVSKDRGSFKKIIFVLWSPNSARVKNKMMYASTKDFFKSQLDGVALELQATEQSEIDEEEVRLRVQATLTRK